MTRRLPILLLALVSLSLGCSKAGPAPEKEVVEEALAQEDVFILDVRSAGEFAGGHVEGAVNLEVSQLGRMETILPDKERQIVVHCAAGVRSAKAASKLKSMGYKNVLDAQTPQAVARAMGKELVK
jgi:rhodanese-related sulfurtransferase